jgi:hypothetical protein
VKNTFRCQIDSADTLTVSGSGDPRGSICLTIDEIYHGDLGNSINVIITDKQALRLAALLVANVQGVSTDG